MHTFHQQVGGDKHFLLGVGEYGTVVAYTVSSRLVLDLYVFGKTVNQTELT